VPGLGRDGRRKAPIAQAIENTGAYGSSMSSNYNSRPLAAEVLLDMDTTRLIRRRQSVEELLALELGN
jgi:diaminopimelate decarboxylase